MTASLPDAMPTNWVDRLAPPPLRPWLRLGRLDRPTGIWLLMLPGWQGIALADGMARRGPEPRLLLLFALGAVLMRAAGCAFNDIVDRDIDARVARTAARPIASGQIGVAAAWAFVAGCALTSLGILIALNLACFWLGVASLILVAIYPFMKRITWWPQAWLGLTFNWGVPMGFAAALGGAPLWSWLSPGFHSSQTGVAASAAQVLAAALLYGSGVLWTLGYDTIYAVQDMEDDALIGVRSSALRLGSSAPAAVMGFYIGATALATAAGVTAGLGAVFYIGLALFAAQLGWQARTMKLDDPDLALRLFKSNTVAGAILFAALALGGVLK